MQLFVFQLKPLLQIVSQLLAVDDAVICIEVEVIVPVVAIVVACAGCCCCAC